jgi:hypothetical protein
MSDDFNFPIVISSTGLQPQDPADLLQQLLDKVAVTNPGYTPNLPGSLIEDISSTDVAAMALSDSAKVELINSLTPDGANQFLLLKLGSIYGVPYGQPSNTSVFIVGAGTVGYPIPDGLLVSDGSNTFQVARGATIAGGGVSPPMQAVALLGGSFGVPANTVTQIITSIPTTVNLTVNNPQVGTPGGSAESWSSYRSRVLQAGLSACVGSPRYIKTLVGRVPGVQKVSVISTISGPRVIVVGGDPYGIADALFRSYDNPNGFVGSGISSGRNIVVSLIDPPNIYNLVYVNSPQQSVTVAVTWNTILPNFASGGAFPNKVIPPLVAYINALQPGLPINIQKMNSIFVDAVSPFIDEEYLTRLVFSVSINGTPVAPGTGTFAVTGDSESYFFTDTSGSGISVIQG